MAPENHALLQCEGESSEPTSHPECVDATHEDFRVGLQARQGHMIGRKSQWHIGRRGALVALAVMGLVGISLWASEGPQLLRSPVARTVGLEEEESPLTPWMGEHDMARLYQLMSKATYYREFGAGGSTVQAVGFSNLKKIVSTESDEAWVNNITKRTDIQKALKSKRLVLEHADIGPVKIWGYPKDETGKARWPAYSNLNDSHAEFDPPFHFDFILVDGRFRVACMLKSVKAITPERRNTTWLAMHDYRGKRKDYHQIEKFVKRIEMDYPDDIDKKWVEKAHHDFFTDNPGDNVLGIFQKRADVDEDELDAMIEKYELHKH